jgi:hypothetical protein
VSRLPFRSQSGQRRPLPILALACTVEAGQAAGVIGAVLTRVLAERCPPGTVILDLGAAADLGDDGCGALHGLLDRLAGCGITVRLAGASAKLRAQLDDGGVASRLGRGGVQPSLRAALLAVYAELPGPGLVTPDIRAALATPAEPVVPAGPAAPAPAPAIPAAAIPATVTVALPDKAITQPGRLVPPGPA